MSGNSLEERLKSNSNAFEGLLSLISAKYYDNDENKVTKKRKLSETVSDIDENGTAATINADENIEEQEDNSAFDEYNNQWKAKKKSKEELKQNKKMKFDKDDVIKTGSVKDMMENMEKQKLVTPAQKLRERLKQKQEQEKKNKQQVGEAETGEESVQDEEGEEEEDDDDEELAVVFDDEGNPINSSKTNNTVTDENENAYNALQNKKKEVVQDENEKKIRKQKNVELLRAKLQNKISTLKHSRKAVGTNVEGAPKSREEILAQRKKKQELIKQRKEEVSDIDSESSDSDSDFDIDEDISADSVMYGSINFDDGSKVTSDLQRIRGKTEKSANDKKGPAKRDYKAQLRILEKKKNKIASKGELDQIQEIENKNWQKAMLQAEGITVRDDEKLLKKALKKKEQKKRKSSVQWRDRKQQVITTIAERTKRREENLRMRKENKGKKRKNQVKLKKSLKGKTMVKKAMENSGNNKKNKNNKRAGFEGNMKRK
ncbi:SURF6-domain-containing protein [Hanseniaspora valbyensis NRRL Y-1626]|uniref:SURF6-domain-containing protein n=1 Tax=Hanseniaspora valbyensis NRRL Y-1626 TaxID=766949 RepID=A0A1B7TGC7_9ASCO|nr:SURF6-domain-containing protein [Hanseniaspora valbyensis NRRL Y-1626]